ncbi:MAG: hypothetical protein WDW38_011423 [Sanguina aurantia]
MFERSRRVAEPLSEQLVDFEAISRGAAAGAILKGGLHLSSWLMHQLKSSARQNLNSLSLGRALADTFKYTAFLGSLAGLYVAVDEALASIFGKVRSSKWRALIAGLVAAQSLRLTGRKQRHYGLASYVLLRGLTLLVRTGNKPDANPLVRTLLTPTRSAHGDSVLMCLASSQILYSFIMMPTTLPAAYVHFITKQGNKGEYVWRAIQEQAIRNTSGLSPGPLESLVNTPLVHLNLPPVCDIPVPCAFFHPGQTCHGHALSLIPHAYLRSLSVYLPVYVIPALLVHRARLLTEAGTLLPKLAAGIARSSAFLALFISSAFGGACIGFNLFGFSTGRSIAASVWLGGLSVLAEKKSRRMELAIYCMSRAQEAASRCVVEWGWVNPARLPARLDILLFALGCAAISHCYSDDHGMHRDVFRSKYLNVLDIIFGNSGVEDGCISHTPTNAELISTMSKKMLKSLSRQMLDITEAASADMGFHPNARLAFSSNSLAQQDPGNLAGPDDLDPPGGGGSDPPTMSPWLTRPPLPRPPRRSPRSTPATPRTARGAAAAAAAAASAAAPTTAPPCTGATLAPSGSTPVARARTRWVSVGMAGPPGSSSRRSSVSQPHLGCPGTVLTRSGSLSRSPPMLPSSFNPLVPTAPIPRVRWGSYDPITGVESVMITPEGSHPGGGSMPAYPSPGGGGGEPAHAAWQRSPQGLADSSPFSEYQAREIVRQQEEDELRRAGLGSSRGIHSAIREDAVFPPVAAPRVAAAAAAAAQPRRPCVSSAAPALLAEQERAAAEGPPTVAESIVTLAAFTMRGVGTMASNAGGSLLRLAGLSGVVARPPAAAVT